MRQTANGWLAALVVSLTGFRLFVAAQVGLGDAEAYYARWARDLEWSYLDHGPWVALLIRAGTETAGQTPFGVRWPFVLLSGATLWLVADLARQMLAPPQPPQAVPLQDVGLWSALLLSAMPMFIVAGAAANPDVPFIFFVALVLRLCLVPPRTLGTLALASLAAGAAFCAKPTAVLLLPLLVWCALRHPRPLHAVLLISACGLAAASPVIYWNLSHDFAMLTYHVVARHTRPVGPSWVNLGKLIGGQLAYVAPLPLWGFWAIALPRVYREREHEPQRTILYASYGLIGGGYLLVLLVPSAEPHWPAAGYLALIPLLATWIVKNGRRARLWIGLGAGYSASVFVAFHVHVLTDVGVRMMPASYVPRYDLANELVGWTHVANRVVAHLSGSSPALVAGCHYTVCGQLAFAAKGRYRVVCPSPRLSQFDFFALPGQPAGAVGDGQTLRHVDLVYVKDERFPFDADVLYRCARTTSVEHVLISRGGRVVRRFELQRCMNFGGLRAGRWPLDPSSALPGREASR